MTKTPTTITAPCLGCEAPLVYTLDCSYGSGAPDLLPPMYGTAYAGGHLCTDCAVWVATQLRERRQLRIARCSVCHKPAHPTETDDHDRCEGCRANDWQRSRSTSRKSEEHTGAKHLRIAKAILTEVGGGRVADVGHGQPVSGGVLLVLQSPCAAEENGMDPCTSDHLARGAACGVCVVKHAAGRAL